MRITSTLNACFAMLAIGFATYAILPERTFYDPWAYVASEDLSIPLNEMGIAEYMQRNFSVGTGGVNLSSALDAVSFSRDIIQTNQDSVQNQKNPNNFFTNKELQQNLYEAIEKSVNTPSLKQPHF